MSKLLFKLVLLAVGIFLLMQVPFFAKFRDQIKAEIGVKLNNLSAEVDRIQGKIEGAEKVIDDTKAKVNAVTNQVSDTVNNVKGAFVSVDKAAADIKNAINGEGEKTTENLQDPKVPAPATPPATPPVSTTK